MIESIQDDLSQEIYSTVDKVLGVDVLESEKQDLLDSLLFIFHQQEKEIINTLSAKGNPRNDIILPNSSQNNNNPFVNIILVNPIANSYPVQNNFYPQPAMNQALPPNPNYFNNQQIQYPMLQAQPYQQPSFTYMNYPMMFNEQFFKFSTDNKKKSHSKSKHKDKHSKSKDKKHSKSKDKKDSKSKKSKESKTTILTFELQDQSYFNGIFHYLTTKTGGNIHDNGTIEVTSNSIKRPSCHPKNLTQQSGTYVAKNGEKYAWICFNFKNMEVEISNYSIKASGTCCMKNWVFEVSNDGSNWTTIDEHRNCLDLKSSGSTRSYRVQPNSFSHFCRIRHNGEFIDYSSGNLMIIERVELYGKLKSQFDK